MPRKNINKAQKIRQYIADWGKYWKKNKDTYNDYTQFIWGNQWLDEEARVFETYKKIPLTFNKLAPMANFLLGEQQQNTPSLECKPVSENLPVETVDVYSALVQEITQDGKSKEVFQCAFGCAIVGGYGAFYAETEYRNNYTFEQVLRAKEVVIPTRCYWDRSAETMTKSDGMYAGYQTRMSRAKFKALYGKKIERDIPPSNLEDGTVFDDDDSITIITHWERDYKPVTIYQLSNGQVVEQVEFDSLEREIIDDGEILLYDGIPVFIEKERKAPRYEVKKYIFAGDYELDKEKTPFMSMPLLFLDQKSFFNKKGEQVTRPFFKDTKDAQRYINYLGTQSAYLIKISRYDQYLVSKNNVRGNDTQAIWRDPVNVQGGLYFDPDPNGFIPQQQKPPELSQSLVQQYDRAEKDLQTCTGMYDTMRGEQGNETSKIAIDARTKRGHFNTNTPFDNLNKAIAMFGELISEAIPIVYDTQRTLNLNIKDIGRKDVEINKPLDEFGGQIQHDLKNSRFEVRLVPGASWEGQKQEALNSMGLVLQANPDTFNMIADLYVENLPLNNNIELKNRLRTLVPPEILKAGKTGQPIPPKQPEQDPMVAIKMQELQLKQQQLAQQQQKLQMDANKTEQEIVIRWQELEGQKQQAAAELQEMELRYTAEAQRNASNEQISHADNLVKLLTHAHTVSSKNKKENADNE